MMKAYILVLSLCCLAFQVSAQELMDAKESWLMGEILFAETDEEKAAFENMLVAEYPEYGEQLGMKPLKLLSAEEIREQAQAFHYDTIPAEAITSSTDTQPPMYPTYPTYPIYPMYPVVYQRPVYYYQPPVQPVATVQMTFGGDPAAVQAETDRILAEYHAQQQQEQQQQEQQVAPETQTAAVIVDVPVPTEAATVEIETETAQIEATLPATLTEQQQETITTVAGQQFSAEQLRLEYERETQRLKYVILSACVVSVPLIFAIGWAFPRMLQEIRHLINAERGGR
jgi:hypothetical protein